MLTETFSFYYNDKLVTADVEVSAGKTEGLDVLNVIGDIMDDLEEVYEIPNKIVLKEFRHKFWNEIENERAELKGELVSVLRDF